MCLIEISSSNISRLARFPREIEPISLSRPTVLAGVNVDAERPAYEHIIIKPILDKRLPEVYYSHMTPYGEVVSEIRQTGRNLEMNVTVPVGSTATIYIPVGGNTSEVTESGISVRDSKDVRFERIQDGNCIVRVPQGKYKFKSNHNK